MQREEPEWVANKRQRGYGLWQIRFPCMQKRTEIELGLTDWAGFASGLAFAEDDSNEASVRYA